MPDVSIVYQLQNAGASIEIVSTIGSILVLKKNITDVSYSTDSEYLIVSLGDDHKDITIRIDNIMMVPNQDYRQLINDWITAGSQ